MTEPMPLGLDFRPSVKFTIPEEPVSKARHKVGTRGGKIRAYKDPKTANAQARVGLYYRQAAGAHELSIRGFGVDMTFYLGSRQRRDIDNFVKLVLDGLTGWAWKDDSQVTAISAKVVHGVEVPHSDVIVYPTDDLPDRLMKECLRCGNDFQLPKSWVSAKKYCSARCRKDAIASRRKRTCQHCRTEFQATGPQVNLRFCSVECKVASTKIEFDCAHCGRHQIRTKKGAGRGPRKFCDIDCNIAYNRIAQTVNAKGTCCDCGGPTSKKAYPRCRACSFAKGKVGRSPAALIREWATQQGMAISKGGRIPAHIADAYSREHE